jgi:hypothetical protein
MRDSISRLSFPGVGAISYVKLLSTYMVSWQACGLRRETYITRAANATSLLFLPHFSLPLEFREPGSLLCDFCLSILVHLVGFVTDPIPGQSSGMQSIAGSVDGGYHKLRVAEAK